MTTYGIGLDWRTGEFYVVVNGTRISRTFRSDAAAVGYVDALKDWNAQIKGGN